MVGHAVKQLVKALEGRGFDYPTGSLGYFI